MYIEAVVLVINTFFYSVNCANTRIYFSRCDLYGFTCEKVNSESSHLIYACPSGATDVTFYLWSFSCPTSIVALTIKDCDKVQLSFLVTSENKPISTLTVANVTNLMIIESTNTRNPTTIILKNIKFLETIPINTFSQIKPKKYVTDLENLYFEKINIGTIHTRAFNNLTNFYNFTWNEVNVQRIHHDAIKINFNTNGNFSVVRSNIEVLEHLSFQILGKFLTFSKNKVVEMQASAINGTIDNFRFNENKVNNMEANAISILSKNVEILDNRFEYLMSSALSRISPGILFNAQMNFGNLKFTYTFNNNFINFMDAGSLHPDVVAYDNVAAHLKFDHNVLYCSCENLGWLMSELGHGRNRLGLNDFYQMIINEESQNICSFTSCKLPVKKFRKFISNGKCLQNLTAENLCKLSIERRPSTYSPSKKDSIKNIFLKSGSTNLFNFYSSGFIVILSKGLMHF